MRHAKWPVKTLVAVVGVVALALGAGALGQAQQGLSGEYKIGVLEPLTGNLAAEGKRHLEGMEIMRDLINERFGGVMGKKLTFVVGDAVDPTVAASEATRLATQGGVKIIAGTFSSTLCGAASEAAARQGVIYWETSCVDPRLTKRGLKNIYRTEIDGTGFGWYNIEFIAKHLAHRLGKKPNELRIAYLSEDSSYGQSVTETARQRAKQEFGMQETGVEYYTFTTNDLTPVILKLKSQNPDILHHIARNQDAILFWRQAREQNFEVKAVVHAGATGYGSPDFGKAFGADGNGPFALLEPGPGFLIDKMRPEGQRIERAYREAVKAKTGSDIAGGHQLAGGGLWVLKLVLDAAKTDDPDKFRAAVMGLDLPTGSALNGWGVKFDENGQNSNPRVQHYMLQWQNGQMVTVWPEEFTSMRGKWIPLGPWDQRK
ncbi:MAG TPA: ABC transporter substrate-binding protein [Verrucomicrobiae bacterium]|jgi:branched-chain amino acid transport system substrate-binding protein|nr:ABC transporter substrate-binding protein [Verrucomicrobiae bacterium]